MRGSDVKAEGVTSWVWYLHHSFSDAVRRSTLVCVCTDPRLILFIVEEPARVADATHFNGGRRLTHESTHYSVEIQQHSRPSSATHKPTHIYIHTHDTHARAHTRTCTYAYIYLLMCGVQNNVYACIQTYIILYVYVEGAVSLMSPCTIRSR